MGIITQESERKMDVLLGLLLPFAGTALGASCVFLLKKEINMLVQKGLLGFASGVMVAASVWSLLIPAMDQSKDMGKLAFIPAAAGFLLGIGFLLLLDKTVPHMHMGGEKEGLPAESFQKPPGKNTLLVLAVTLHNIPEGMAVGVVFAGMLEGSGGMTLGAALTLSLGIAIQNFPEGAVVSMPLRTENGMGKGKAFFYGAASGAVEPLAAGVTLLLTQMVAPILPYILAFAAGAMIYVVVEELIPEASMGSHSNIGTIGFAAGFVIMMILDVALG